MLPDTPIKTVQTPCVHCGGEDGTRLWSGNEHEYDNTTDAEFAFKRCASCGIVRLDPRPDVTELGRIYPPQYYAYNLLAEGQSNDGTPGILDRMKIRMYQGRVEGMVERLGKSGKVRILDVGCADGRILSWYQGSDVGDRLETHGIEMDESAASAARDNGHTVVTGRFEADTGLEDNSFDLITAAHVIEHVDDPVRFAERAAELLAPGGLFVVYTPNWDSPDALRFRGNWGGNHFPRHWTLYDEDGLKRLSESIGLEFERVEYQPNPIFWVWTCHSWLKQRFPRSRWPDRVFPTVAIFHQSLWSFVLLSIFTMVDLGMRAATGKTGSIAVELRKPSGAS